jgi:hypothetical protein
MSSRWVYHHRREHGVTLENWRLYCDFWESAHRPRLCVPPSPKHNTHHHHYILLRSLCIITLSLFSRDPGFACLEIPISVVIWIGFFGRGEKGKRCDTYFWSILCSVSSCWEQLVQLTLFMLAACDLFKARFYIVLLEGIGWMDGLIFSLRALVVFFDGYLLLPPILLNIYKHKKV